MIEKKRVLAVIPARGGSKGLPGKNIRDLGGKPLLAWTIEAALGSAYVDKVILSSDDEAIIQTARRHGCEVPFKRPAHLATDNAATIDVLLHAMQSLPQYDLVILLQPTSPLRSSADIDKALETLLSHQATSCVSVTTPSKSPYWMFTLNQDDCLSPLIDPAYSRSRRQELPEVYSLNGAIYIAEAEWLAEHKDFIGPQTCAYHMPPHRSLDIDSLLDLRIADVVMQEFAHELEEQQRPHLSQVSSGN